MDVVGFFAVLGLFALAVIVLYPERPCPECGHRQSKFAMPGNLHELLHGGTTCPRCGCRIDRRGRRVP